MSSFDELPVYLPPQYNLFNYDGYLTAPSTQSPIAIAENYLRSHAADVGLLQSDLDNYVVTTNYVTNTTGATTLTFQQTLHGLPVVNANFNITVAADGRLLTVGGGFVPHLSARSASIPTTGFDAAQAILSTARAFELELSGPPIQLDPSPDGPTVFRAPVLSRDDIPATMQYVAVPGDTVKLVWNTIVRTPDNSHWYSLNIDANSGQVLDAVDFVNRANYEVFANPKRDPDDGPRTIETNPHLITPTPSPVPSPFGWHDINGFAGAEFTITLGNNVNAFTDRNFDFAVDLGSQPDGGPGLDFSGQLVGLNLADDPSAYANAAVVNLFYWVNVAHDVHYLYGFDEAARNFQFNNYFRGGLGSDPVQAAAQAGADVGFVNNAFFATPPDGIPPLVAMFEWNLTNPRRDGDLDAEIIVHEYGHGVSNRLTGNASGLEALQSGGMGEGWSDWWSLMFGQTSASDTVNARGVGTYVLGEPRSGLGIRDFRYDFDITNQFQETFLSYGIGPGQSVQVHFAGTRWAAALWDINHLLIQKYGYNPNLYDSTSDAGNVKALHLIMNALKIQPLNPSFIQARDAILLADQLLYGGANQFEIWSAFARRGLGAFATTSSSDSPLLVTSFEIPSVFLPVVSMGPDVAALEGDVGNTPLAFSVTIAGNLHSQVVTVAYTTVNGTAIGGADFLTQSGTVTFTPGGSLTQSITVQIIGDLTIEPNETFQVQLGAATNATVLGSAATGTILNDDVELSINDITVVEGNAGTTNATFTVSAAGILNRTVSVSYATSDGTAQGALDYQPRGATVTIDPGASFTTIVVPIINDTANEADESFFVLLATPVNARIADGVGIATIIDNDILPSLYVNDALVSTMGPGAEVAVFTVALDHRSGRNVTVSYTTVDDTAQAGLSYTAQSGVLTFLPGVSTLPVTVPIMPSAVYAPNERFFLDLSLATAAGIADGRGTGTIIFADPPPTEFVVDDGDPGFTAASGWTNVTNVASYGLDYSYHAPGSGSGKANWSFLGIPNGTYQVLTRWSHFSNRATNATYTVHDALGPLGSATVNQQLAPSGDHAAGVAWQSLGSYVVVNRTLRVELTDAANGYVIADAVRIVSGNAVPQAPEIDVAGFERSIADGDTTPSLADGTDFGATPPNSTDVTRTFTIHNSGNAVLNLTGSSPVQISGPHAADFTVTREPSLTVAPGGTTSFDVKFSPSTTGLRQATISIANDDASESLYDFAIAGTGATPIVPLAQHNAAMPTDVNGDTLVSPVDALLVINELLRASTSQTNGPSAAPQAATASPGAGPAQYYLDVNGDGSVSPHDALLVVNQLLNGAAAGPPGGPAVEPASAAAPAEPSSDLQMSDAIAAVVVDIAIDQTEDQDEADTVLATDVATTGLISAGDEAIAGATLMSVAESELSAPGIEEDDDASDADSLLAALGA